MTPSDDSPSAANPSDANPSDDNPSDANPSDDSPSEADPAGTSLAAAMAAHQIELPAEQVAKLDRYCTLLWEWNAKINLTRHTDYPKFVARDLVDSLAIAEFLEPHERVLDVGTGGGVPGVVLAIVRPELSISLCESVGKKARAVSDMVARLGLRVPVIEGRAEAVLSGLRLNTLVVRAVARLPKLLRWFRPHLDRFDRLLILKGPAWVEERGQARHEGLLKNLALRKLTEYPLPGTDSQSVLLQICRKQQMLDAKRCRITPIDEKPKARSRPPRREPPWKSRKK